jgi:PAS domain-containing protein
VIPDDDALLDGRPPPHTVGLDDLRERHARVMFMLNAARMGTWDANLTTDDVTWSEGLPTIFGLDTDHLGGTITMDAFMELVHPADREAFARKVSKADATDEFGIEFRRVWPDGSLHWLESKGYVVRDDAGRAVRAVGVPRASWRSTATSCATCRWASMSIRSRTPAIPPPCVS